MRKDELRSAIWNNLPKYEELERHHPRVVDAYLEKALAEYYNLVFLRNPLELQRYTCQFGYTTPIAIAYEAATHLYYSSYPTGISIIPIPDKASGVRRVSTIIQGSATFFPIDAREFDLVQGGAYVDSVTAKVGYCPRRTRIEYYKPTAAIIAAGVRLDLLIPFSQYADSDIVLVPELVNDQGLGLIDRVLQMFEKTPPIDLIENTKTQETK